jgi:homoserine dehydrogenase
MKPIQVGLLGMGTVGSGTFNVLQRNQEEIKRRAGRAIEIAMVADLDVAKAQALCGPHVKVVNDARQVIANPDIDIVVELIGGYGNHWCWKPLRLASMWSQPTRLCWQFTVPKFLQPPMPKV